MPKISAVALSFAFVLSPVLAVVCEMQCVRPIAAAAAPAGCHSAEPPDAASIEHEAACVHAADVPSVAAASDRDARQRLVHAGTAFAAHGLAAETSRAGGRQSASPPGAARAPVLSARHRILRV